ncbi:hypothetical protein Yalta_068 [Yalta virus]|nr:hypothetical protein Yalta_068 [Yalta virus]
MSDDDSKFYIFKALGYNIGKSKFDTKGFSITNLPSPINDSDAVNLGYLKREYLPLKKECEDVKKEMSSVSLGYKNNSEFISQIKNDLIELSNGFTPKQKKQLENYITVDKLKEARVNLVNEMNKFQNSVLKEVTYEVNAKKEISNNIETFVYKRIVEPGINRRGLSYINLYSSIDLFGIGCKITFISADNKEIHTPIMKKQRELKEPFKMSVKSKDKNSHEDIITFVSNHIAHFERYTNKVKLDKKFLERIKMEPDNIRTCFVKNAEEARLHKNVREVTNNVENIHITMVFVLLVTYNKFTMDHSSGQDD